MVNVQMSAMVASHGYSTTPLRTGAEDTIGMRADNAFAHSISKKGTVMDVTDAEIIIKEEDGTFIGIPIGTNHIDSAGIVIPHKVITDLKKGDKVNPGDIACWVDGYFERDWLNPRNVSFKLGVMAKVALQERNPSREDGSLISPALAEKLKTDNSKRKMLVVDFTKEIFNLVKPGQNVNLDSVLCHIQDESVSTGEITEEQIKGLSRYGINAPKAKFVGTVSKIEVFWYGQKADMSPTLQKLVDADTRRRKREAAARGKADFVDGEIFEEGFMYSEKIENNQVGIAIYMDNELADSIGDKGTVAGQLKTIFSGIMSPDNRTLSGDSIDMIFGHQSVMNRIVPSVEIWGITNSVLKEITRQTVESYFQE